MKRSFSICVNKRKLKKTKLKLFLYLVRRNSQKLVFRWPTEKRWCESLVLKCWFIDSDEDCCFSCNFLHNFYLTKCSAKIWRILWCVKARWGWFDCRWWDRQQRRVPLVNQLNCHKVLQDLIIFSMIRLVALLQRNQENVLKFFCGAALISKTKILTGRYRMSELHDKRFNCI